MTVGAILTPLITGGFSVNFVTPDKTLADKCCETALALLETQKYDDAWQQLTKAYTYDPDCRQARTLMNFCSTRDNFAPSIDDDSEALASIGKIFFQEKGPVVYISKAIACWEHAIGKGSHTAWEAYKQAKPYIGTHPWEFIYEANTIEKKHKAAEYYFAKHD